MSTSEKRVEKLIEETKIGFGNAKDNPDISVEVAGLGYGEPRLISLTQMTGLLNNKYQHQQEMLGLQIVATNNLEEKFQYEMKFFRDLRAAGKKAIRGKKYERFSQLLGLDLKLSGSLEGFQKQAQQFYSNALKKPEILALFSKYGITAQQLQERLDALDEINELNKKQEELKGFAQIARADRDNIFGKLNTEWVDFKDLCRRKFGKTSQTLEIMGIKAPSVIPARKTPEEPPAEEPPVEEPQETRELQTN